jgi:hypothetical protein
MLHRICSTIVLDIVMDPNHLKPVQKLRPLPVNVTLSSLFTREEQKTYLLLRFVLAAGAYTGLPPSSTLSSARHSGQYHMARRLGTVAMPMHSM